jgi:ATP phosphoribosyltransferase regulatory subunit HisZ
MYAPGASDALVRGGRYDEVGASRGAVGRQSYLRNISHD